MTRLSVNINKIATLRNARGCGRPDVVRVALDCERFGAQGITVHPRPDERHITRQDVYDLRSAVRTEFNIEGFPDARFMDIVTDVVPAQVTLVPDAPGQITSNHGWDTLTHASQLRDVTDECHRHGIRVSIFVDADARMVEGAKTVGADRVELYTEPYASAYGRDRETAIAPFVAAAQRAQALGMGLNAGHDLSLDNLAFLVQRIPYIDEVSIGHALICDALYMGLEHTVVAYLQQLNTIA